MGTYRITDSRRKMQLGPTAEAETMAAMFEPVELALRNERIDALDLEKLDTGSGEWRLMCKIVRETEFASTSS